MCIRNDPRGKRAGLIATSMSLGLISITLYVVFLMNLFITRAMDDDVKLMVKMDELREFRASMKRFHYRDPVSKISYPCTTILKTWLSISTESVTVEEREYVFPVLGAKKEGSNP